MTQPIFVPKHQVPEAVELTLDETLEQISEVMRIMAPLKAKYENLKVVAKQHLIDRGEMKYVAPNGATALRYAQTRMNCNKEKLQELLGDKFSEAVTFKTSESFKVTIPGVKSPDAD